MFLFAADEYGDAALRCTRSFRKARKFGIPAEHHTYATRTHCFQYKAVPGTGSYAWLERVQAFLRRRGVLKDSLANR